MLEHESQAAVFNWFSMAFPRLEMFFISYTSGAMLGGKNKYGGINKLKKEGWRSGVPDFAIFVPVGGFHGLFIEMKADKKTDKSLSVDQVKYLTALTSQGYFTARCSGFNEAMECIKNYMSGSLKACESWGFSG